MNEFRRYSIFLGGSTNTTLYSLNHFYKRYARIIDSSGTAFFDNDKEEMKHNKISSK